MAGLVLKDDIGADNIWLKIVLALIVLAIGVFGCFVHYVIHDQFVHITNRILHLYSKMNMRTDDFIDQNVPDQIHTNAIWAVGYVSYFFISLLCAIAISLN